MTRSRIVSVGADSSVVGLAAAGREHRGLEPVEHRLAALVGLDHDVDRADPLELRGVAVVLPVVRAGDAERGDLVVPERLGAALALDEDDVAELAGLPQARQPVQAELRALLPAELVLAVDRDAEADRLLVAVAIDVRHAHGRRVDVLRIRETERAEEVDREALGLGVRLERARTQPLLIRLQRCNTLCTPPTSPLQHPNPWRTAGLRAGVAVLHALHGG